VEKTPAASAWKTPQAFPASHRSGYCYLSRIINHAENGGRSVVTRKHSKIFCPQCNSEQQWGIISFMGWFPCPVCGINLHIPDGWTRAHGVLGFVVAAIILVAARLSLWVSLLVFTPIYVCAVGILGIVWLEISPPKLETDIPSSPPGSLGLNSR